MAFLNCITYFLNTSDEQVLKIQDIIKLAVHSHI